ncbi:MAG: TetR family transcriptional regulator, partial [Bradyrhizobium sp.]
RKEIDAQVALAPVLLKEHPPLAALRLWCDRFIQFGEAKYGIAETFHAAISDQDLQEVYKTLASAIGKLINACEQAGTIQPGTRAEDVLTLLGLLLRVPSKFGGRERARRILDIMFRGLSA